MKDRDALDAVRETGQWFLGLSDGVAERPSDVLPALLYLIGDARLVLIGEATHDTDAFYSIRAASTKALIRSKQFNLVAVEADWPDAYRVKWAHNSHLGDARAAQMGAWGEVNLGQLARQRHGDRVFLIGFTTHTGTVTGAREWRARRRPACDSIVTREL